MRYVLALDQGTTSSRALLFDEHGQRVAVAQQPFTQHFPRPGWVEHDPMEILSTQLTVAREAITGIHPTEIAALGITNQRETTILWDRSSGEPIAPAIVWQDRRTADFCARLREEGHAEGIADTTGLVVDPYFSATKIAWLLENVEGARVRAERGELAFGTVDTWLTWHLTGGLHVTDVTNASRTMLTDLRTGQWSEAMLELFRIPRAILPEIAPTSGIVGATTLFGGLTPIAALAGDQHAATFAQGCWEEGMAKNTYGTGCFLLMNTGARPVASRQRLLTTPAWKLGSASTQYALEGSVFVAGAAVQWVRDTLGILDDADASEALAASVPDSGGVSFVPAFTGLGAPYWDADARGMVIGITRGTTAGHLARATLDAIALQTADLVEALHADAGTPLRELRVDGGGSRNNLLMQIQADLIGVPVVRPVETETTALGAAHLAGLAVEMWDAMTLQTKRSVDRVFEPRITQDERFARQTEWRRAVERCRGWA